MLIELTEAHAVLALYESLRADTPPWVVELVPAARTILVVYDRRRSSRAGVEQWMRGAAPRGGSRSGSTAATATPSKAALGSAAGRATPPAEAQPGSNAIELPVRYDGPDLQDLADSLGLTVEALIRAHTETSWRSAFIGFAPGFAYLAADSFPFDIPRRAVPRTAVPAGSVALAAGYCGVYPRESPGGWQLIGTTEATLWDPSRPQPALLAPGTRVRFARVG